jgi:hypothetical protein
VRKQKHKHWVTAQLSSNLMLYATVMNMLLALLNIENTHNALKKWENELIGNLQREKSIKELFVLLSLQQ